MDWNEAITQWETQQKNRYGAKDKHGEFIGWKDWPEQDITVEYNGKPLIHCNGDYKPGMIKKAMLSKVIAKQGRIKIYEDETEAYNTVMQAEGKNVKVQEIENNAKY